ncbi:MAG: NAD(P)/FAD-dependent oxidoreductase [Phycisphaerales bacterium JB039]
MNRACAIIGAGPAGSACAIALAGAGWRVSIFEKARFPRAKVCGEFISPAATDILESLLSPAELESLGARRCGAVVIHAGPRTLRRSMPRPGWALSRRTLDHALLDRARRAGAAVQAPVVVRAVNWTGPRPLVRTDRAEQSFDIVIHADGAGRHDPAGPTASAGGLVGLKRHFLPPQPDPGAVRLFAAPSAYLGTIDIEDGLSTCALTARTTVTRRFGPDTDALVRDLWPALDLGEPQGPWLACPVARSQYTAPGHIRSFRIGNAAGAVDPVGGEGIGLALWSATTLAGLLAGAEAEPAALAPIQRAFARLYRARLCARLPACRLAAETLMRPRLAAALTPLLDAGGFGAWYRLTGKPVRTLHT